MIASSGPSNDGSSKKVVKKNSGAKEPGGESQEAIRERLNKVLGALPERARSWLPGSDPIEADKLIDLLTKLCTFLGATSEDAQKSFPSVDKTVEKYLKKYLKSPEVLMHSDSSGAGSHPPGFPVSSAFVEQQGGIQKETGDLRMPPAPVPAASPEKSAMAGSVSAGRNLSGGAGDDIQVLLKSVADLHASQKKLLSAIEAGKKNPQTVGKTADDFSKIMDVITVLHANVSKLPTTEAIGAGFANLEAINTKTGEGIQNVQNQLSQLATAVEENKVLVKTEVEGIDQINVRIDGKIDLADAVKLIKLRAELEPHVRAELIRSVSKEVMVAVETMKEVIPPENAALMKAIGDLENRCQRAGLLPVDQLF